MEKEFVPYELALRMKQLGFDEPCFGYYGESQELIWKSGYAPWVNSERSLVDMNFGSAPLFQQAFRWLLPQIDGEFKVCLGENGWYVYNLENQVFEGDVALEKLIQIVEQRNVDMTDYGVYK
jgi:hypothetical protein